MIFSKRWRTIRRIKKDAILVARLLGTRNLLQNSSHTFEDSMIRIMVYSASTFSNNIDIQVLRKDTWVKVFDGWNDERTYCYKPGQWEGYLAYLGVEAKRKAAAKNATDRENRFGPIDDTDIFGGAEWPRRHGKSDSLTIWGSRPTRYTQ